MDDKSIIATAEELNMPEDVVRNIIRELEKEVADNISTATMKIAIETRVMGFGRFAIINDRALYKYKENVRRTNDVDVQRSKEDE